LPDFDSEISSFGHISPDTADDLSDNDHKAYILYNKAIDDIKAGNEDIAFIKLKKALSAKPDLHEARVIIGLYHAKIGDGSKALDVFEEIIRIDKEKGADALKYIRMLNADREYIPTTAPKNTEKKDKKYDLKKYRMVFLVIFLIILVCLPVLLAKHGSGISDDAKAAISSQDLKISEMDMALIGRDAVIQNLSQEVKDLQGSLESETGAPGLSVSERDEIAQSAIQSYRVGFESYLDILDLYDIGMYLDAADAVIEFKEINGTFAEALGEKFSSFYLSAMNKAARYCEDRGVALYDETRYDESLEMLERAQIYRPDYERMYRVAYFIGKDLLAKGDYDAAKDKFLEVIQIAPNSDWVNYANIRLSEINELTKNE
jgi:tetratricopeptide (TPR) repeat protein